MNFFHFFFLNNPSNYLLFQPAVDALSDREIQLALRDGNVNGNDGDSDDEFEWSNGEYKGNKEQ